MKKISLAAIGAALALAISGCAGSAGESGTDEAGSGFVFGASQQEVDAAIADLEPVTLTYQTAAASPDSLLAKDKVWAEAIEERSGGKITVEIVYGQAIADYTEVHDALADGRVDLAYTLPGYDPAKFPHFDDLSFALSALPSSPLVGELAANAAALELSWNSEAVVNEFEDQGLVPLFPVHASATFYPACTEPGAAAEDWNGRQLRVGSVGHQTMAQNLGATPVSMSFVEVYEALQRNTVDCSMISLNSAYDYGFLDVASHVSYTTGVTVPRAPGAILGGLNVKDLPLPYRQIIHDTLADAFVGTMDIVVDGNFEAVSEIHESDGSVQEFDGTSQQVIAEGIQQRVDEINEKGTFGSDLGEDVIAAGTKWAEKAAELGFVDDGDLSDFDDWYDDTTDFKPFADAVFLEILQAHRPS